MDVSSWKVLVVDSDEEDSALIRTILDTLPVGIGIFDSEGRLVESNLLGSQIFDVRAQDCTTATPRGLKGVQKVGQGPDLQEILISQVLNGESFFGREVIFGCPDGSSLPVLVSGSPARDRAGKVTGAVVTWTDISQRKRLEEELKASEENYRELVRLAPAGIYEIDFRTQRFKSVNDAMCKLSGFSREELLGMNPFDILDDEGKILFRTRIQRWIAGEEPEKNVEYKVRAKDGHTIHALLNSTFTKDAEGIPLGATVIGFDITESKQAKETLRQNQEHINRLVNTSYEGIWSVDQVGKTNYINKRAAEILGYTVEEILGSEHAFGFLMSGEEPAGRQTLARIAAGESGRVEAHARRKDGSEAILLVSYSPVIDEAGTFQGALAMFTDITERKQAEQSLQETTERLREYSERLETRVRERTAELVSLQQQLVDNVEAERLWVSQELHDGPMQEVYGLIFQISALIDKNGSSAMQSEVASVVDKLKQINEELRTIARELRPISLTPFGLEKAIREHSERFDIEHPELSLSLDLMADQKHLPEQVRLSLFRIYQTALSNVIRHAQAKQIAITFSFDETKAILEIQDDGRGFDVPERLRSLAGQGHYGLAGAAERAEAMGGTLEVTSATGKGTRLRVTVPVAENWREPVRL